MKIVALDLQRDLKQLEFHKNDYILKYQACDSLLNMLDMNPKEINVHTYYVLLASQLGYWDFNSNDKSRNEADTKGYYRNLEDSELAYMMSKYSFFLLDYSTVEDEASKQRIKLQNEIPNLTEEKFYKFMPTTEFDKIPATLGIKPLTKDAIRNLKYTTFSFKHLDWAFQLDIDSLSIYAKKAIEIIDKKYK
jgi:hypothetical protein